jgi:hypothetical protein
MQFFQKERREYMKKFWISVVEGTLKRDGKHSSTLWTMAISMFLFSFMAFIDFLMNGINFQIMIILACMATGVKITDAVSKKIKS